MSSSHDSAPPPPYATTAPESHLRGEMFERLLTERKRFENTVLDFDQEIKALGSDITDVMIDMEDINFLLETTERNIDACHTKLATACSNTRKATKERQEFTDAEILSSDSKQYHTRLRDLREKVRERDAELDSAYSSLELARKTFTEVMTKKEKKKTELATLRQRVFHVRDEKRKAKLERREWMEVMANKLQQEIRELDRI
ncbi:hypothetical protein ACLX1H_011290 [Fusarium chlamydosporum]